MFTVRLIALLFASFSIVTSPLQSQQATTAYAPARDPQAVLLLQASIKAMGGSVPADSVATGTITIVLGPDTTSGTIRILTKGTNQSSEQIQLPNETRTVTYSDGAAQENAGPTNLNISTDLMLTDQSPCFPLPILAQAIQDTRESISYVGIESRDGHTTNHLRLFNTFASKPAFQRFATSSAFDLWLDATTSLPVRISRIKRSAEGASPRIPFDVEFSNYQVVSGVAYPFLIQESLNGTPWMTITISNVSFNTGLTDSNFPVE
jgi:hypothetical protein